MAAGPADHAEGLGGGKQTAAGDHSDRLLRGMHQLGVSIVMGVPLYRWMVFVGENPNMGVPPLMDTPIYAPSGGFCNQQNMGRS